MASSRFELQSAGSQLLLDFECWISHCRVMSVKARGDLQALPSAVTPSCSWANSLGMLLPWAQAAPPLLRPEPCTGAASTHRCCPFLCRRWSSNKSLGPGWQRGSCGREASSGCRPRGCASVVMGDTSRQPFEGSLWTSAQRWDTLQGQCLPRPPGTCTWVGQGQQHTMPMTDGQVQSVGDM